MGTLLFLLILLPLVGALATAIVPERSAKSAALLAALATLACGALLAMGFQFNQDLSQVQPWQHWAESLQIRFGDSASNPFALDAIGFRFHLGVDAISLWLVLLTVLLMPLAILASHSSITDRPRQYYAWMLVLLSAMNGVFVAQDLLLFYVFFELTLIPMFFIIGIWGGADRRYAAGKFFLYTFAGSVFTLAGVVYLGLKAGTFDLGGVIVHAQSSLSDRERWLILLSMLAGFSVKVPLFPVHTWLPLAHTEAPTAGSVILAGVLLKLGTYGLLRLALPIGLVVPHAADVIDLSPERLSIAFPGAIKALGVLCVIGIIYGALVAWVQKDIKKLVAYSSVSHLGFCVLGMLALNIHGMQGSVLYMINHGLSTGALFLLVGMIYDRYHTRDIDALSGLARRMPKLGFFLVLFSLSSIGLPGLNGFISEFLTILGAFTSDYLGMSFGAAAALGVILGAVYMLHLLAKVVFGPLKTPGDSGHASHGHGSHSHEISGDLNAREVGILIPLAVAVVLLGVVPSPVLDSIKPGLELIRRPLAQAPQAQVQAAEPSIERPVVLAR